MLIKMLFSKLLTFSGKCQFMNNFNNRIVHPKMLSKTNICQVFFNLTNVQYIWNQKNLLHSHQGYSIATAGTVLLLLFNFGTFCLYTRSADIFFSLLLVQTVTTAFTFSCLFRAFGWCLVAFNYEPRFIYSSPYFVVLNGLKVERWANCHVSILHRGKQGDEPAWEKKRKKKTGCSMRPQIPKQFITRLNIPEEEKDLSMGCL